MRNLATRHKIRVCRSLTLTGSLTSLIRDWNETRKDVIFSSRAYALVYHGLSAYTNRVFSLTWPASMQIYWNKRERLHKKRVQLPQD